MEGVEETTDELTARLKRVTKKTSWMGRASASGHNLLPQGRKSLVKRSQSFAFPSLSEPTLAEKEGVGLLFAALARRICFVGYASRRSAHCRR